MMEGWNDGKNRVAAIIAAASPLTQDSILPVTSQ